MEQDVKGTIIKNLDLKDMSLFESYKTYKSVYMLKHGVKRWETFSTEDFKA